MEANEVLMESVSKMVKNTPPMSKLTKVYLSKFFEKNNPPYDEWDVTLDGVTHKISNRFVIISFIVFERLIQ